MQKEEIQEISEKEVGVGEIHKESIPESIPKQYFENRFQKLRIDFTILSINRFWPLRIGS